MIKAFLIALISSLGYCIIFNIRGKHLIGAALGGAISWVSYYIFIETIFKATAERGAKNYENHLYQN